MPDQPPAPLSQPIDDLALQYLAYEGGRPTIVLLHATGFLPWLWHPIARRLAAEYEVIAPYFCTHREADPDNGGLDWMQLADDLTGLCRSLGVAKPILVGHSMGATLATLAHAADGLEAGGLILIEPIFLPPSAYQKNWSASVHPLASKALRRRNRWANAAEMKAYLKSKALFSHWEAEFLALYIKHGTVPDADGGLELACPPPNEAALFMGGTLNDPWPLLPRVKCPVLVVEGADSDLRGSLDLPAAASRFPRGRYQCIADAGHLIPMEQPAAILSVIRGFVREIEAACSPHDISH